MGKSIPLHATQSESSRGAALFILYLSTRRIRVVNFTPWLFYPYERTLVLSRRLGRLQNKSGYFRGG